MTSVTISPKRASPNRASPKRVSPKVKKMVGKRPAAYPKTSDMVAAAINGIKDRKGSSLAAIKKYIAAHYTVDIVRISPFIRMALKKGVISAKFIQVSGTGASGRFRLGARASVKLNKPKTKKTKKPKTKKAKKPKKPKTKKVKKAKKLKAKKSKKLKHKKAMKKSTKKRSAVKKHKVKRTKKTAKK